MMHFIEPSCWRMKS